MTKPRRLDFLLLGSLVLLGAVAPVASAHASGGLGALGLRWLLGLGGCVQQTCQGAECQEEQCPSWDEDYPVSTSFGMDVTSTARAIREACAPGVVNGWDAYFGAGPKLSDECSSLLLSLWPLSSELAAGTSDEDLSVKASIVRATYALLYYPLATDGQLMDVGDTYFCPGISEGFLASLTGADRAIDPAAWDRGEVVNTEILRHLIERLEVLETDYDYENEGTIAYVPDGSRQMALTDIFPSGVAIDEAAILVHESRHIDDGFDVSARHETCDHGLDQGKEGACDAAGINGSYGTQVQYFDALLKGSGELTTPTGQYLLSDYEVELSVFFMCYYLQNRINDVPEELLQPFEGKDCFDLDDDSDAFDAFLAEHFGVFRNSAATTTAKRARTGAKKSPGRGLIDRATVRVPILR